ncbi:MAG: NUDIX hydrolase [Microthrixaceae bacterium]
MTDPTPPRPGSPGAPLWDPTAIPAATVVVVRDGRSSSDGPGGLEVLVLRRDRDLSFAGGTWVFPGGRIDPADHPVGGQDLELAARTAAVREANEEAGLVIDPSRLRRWSHWTPPPETPKRFSTAFFVASVSAGNDDVVIDDGEIREARVAGSRRDARAARSGRGQPHSPHIHHLDPTPRLHEQLGRGRGGPRSGALRHPHHGRRRVGHRHVPR